MQERPGQPLSLGDIVRWAVISYRQHFNEFFPIAAVGIPGGLLSSVLAARAGNEPEDVALLLAYLLPAMLSAWLVNAALVMAASEAWEGVAPDLVRSFREVLRRAPPLVGAGTLQYAAMLALTFTIVGIPVAIYLAVRWAFVQQQIMLRGQGMIAAFGSSGRVVSGVWWRTFGRLLAIMALVGLPWFAVAATTSALSEVTGMVLGAMMSAALQPFGTAATTLLFFDAEARKESHVRPD